MKRPIALPVDEVLGEKTHEAVRSLVADASRGVGTVPARGGGCYTPRRAPDGAQRSRCGHQLALHRSSGSVAITVPSVPT